MDYSILAIRTTDEEDGRLHPVVADAHSIAPEAMDGTPLRVLASGLTVREQVAGGWRPHLRLANIKAEVLITDTRFAVSCAKFDKGGGRWRIGAAFALLAHGVSKTRTAHRRRGEMLVGHVRYPWLRSVGFKPKAGWGTSEEVSLGVVVMTREGASRELFLDVRFPKNVDSATVARAIVARAARYELSHSPSANATERRRYEELADGPRLDLPAPKQFAIYELTRFSFVSATSAHPTAGAQAEG